MQRYGQPFRTSEVEDHGKIVYFLKDGFINGITFFEDKADALYFTKSSSAGLSAKRLSDNEVELLMKANGGSRIWKKRSIISMDQEWETDDSSMMATQDPVRGALLIETKDKLVRTNTAKAEREAKALKGF